MKVFMSLEEYATYNNMVASGLDADLAFQQLIRLTTAELQVETLPEEEQEPEEPVDISEQPEPEQTEQPAETTVEQISQN